MPLFSGKGGRQAQIAAADREQIAAIPERFEWKVERRGPGGRQPVCDGELLLLFDEPVRWGEVVPFYHAFAKVGIWRLSFVGQKDPRARCKLPANLPFDRGL